MRVIPSQYNYYRLVALWAVCEAMLGGIIHGLKIPVSGIVIGSCAVTCISLIAWYYPAKGSILKATLIVAVCKMILSPQASFPAYIAVLFQGVLGELLFYKRRFYALSCFLLAILSLVESGFQRILILTIVYGNALWTVIASKWIAAGYLLLHLLTGALIGTWISVLPKKLDNWQRSDLYWLDLSKIYSGENEKIRKRKISRKLITLVWFIFLGLYIQSYYHIGNPILPSHVSIKVLLRSLIIIIGWIFIAGPLLRNIMHYWLRKKQTASKNEMQEVMKLMPQLRQVLRASIERSRKLKGLKRVDLFSKLVLVNALFSRKSESGFYILEGKIQSGKTSSLIEWAKQKNNVYGILTPVIDGKRMFCDVHTGELFSMEAESGEKDVLTVGRYIFSRTAFERATRIIREKINHKGWLIIDEIGPMELRGEGFAEVLKEAISIRKEKTLIVVREGIEQKVAENFNIRDNEPIRIHQLTMIG